MPRPWSVALAGVSLLCASGCQQSGQDSPAAESSRVPLSALPAVHPIGTAAEVLASVEASHVVGGASFALPVSNVQSLDLTVVDVRRDERELVMTGHVQGAPESPFMLRGNAASFYGWVHLREQKRAFEVVTTDGGVVIVDEVPVRRICSSCDRDRPRPQAAEAAAPGEAMLGQLEVSRMEATPTANEPHLGGYPGTDLLTLQSRPGAKKVLYLQMEPVLVNGAPSSATTGTGPPWTKEDFYRVWQAVSAGYSAFDVNVTTSPAVFAKTATADVGVAEFIARNETTVCYQGTFGTGRYQCSIYVTKPQDVDALGLGRSVIHELGHLLGMLDAGDQTNTYYPGSKTYQWYPIMGYYYNGSSANAVVQWSKGEWTGANADAKIDAIASIKKFLPLRADDIPESKPLVIDGTAVSPDDNRGQITEAADTDGFTFQIGAAGGKATLTIDRIEYVGGAMLDVLATLKNSAGSVVATSNPTANRSATIDQTLTEGSYTLVIQGGSEGTAATGFTAYSSIGFYGIQGTVTGAVSSGAGGSGGSNGTGGAGGVGGAGGATGATGGSSGRGGAGGTSGGGGATGSGGRPGTGGMTTSVSGSGGRTASGGATGGVSTSSGGAVGVGGAASRGGAIGSGGRTGSGGATGSGGRTGSGGGGSAQEGGSGAGGSAGSAGAREDGGSGGSAGTAGGGGAGGASSTGPAPVKSASGSGCSCRVGSAPASGAGLVVWAVGLSAVWRLGRRRSHARRS